MINRYGLIIVGLIALLLTGCGQSNDTDPQYTASNISGIMPGLAFQLTDENDQPVAAEDYRDKLVLLYFGYTHCPDVCPTTLAKLAGSLKRLGPSADDIRVLFISVDPQRDTPKLLKQYTAAFAPQVIGLTGTQSQLTDLVKRYRVAYRHDEPDAQGNYDVYHSSALFIFDPDGEASLIALNSETAPELTQDLKALLGASLE